MRPARLITLINLLCFAALCSLQEPVCCAQDQQEQKELRQAREFYRAGQKYMLEGDFAAANEEFMKAEIVLRSSPEAPLPEAPSVGLEAPALPQEKAAAPGNALDADIYYNLGVGALQKGDFAQAEAAFLRVAELSPFDKEACYNLGVLYEKYLNKPQEAIRFYTRYVNLSGAGDRDVDRVQGWIVDLKERMKR